jgi:hypothetical protein
VGNSVNSKARIASQQAKKIHRPGLAAKPVELKSQPRLTSELAAHPRGIHKGMNCLVGYRRTFLQRVRSKASLWIQKIQPLAGHDAAVIIKATFQEPAWTLHC